MKINNEGFLIEKTKLTEKLYEKNKAAQIVSRNDEEQVSKADSVELSRKSLLIQKAQEIVQNTPEIRSELVSNLRDSISSGSYQVDQEAVADQILSELDLNKIL